MDFELDDEQVELRRVVRDVAERECPAALVRAVVGGSDDGSGLWKTFVELDWPSLTVPAGDGESDHGRLRADDEAGCGGDFLNRSKDERRRVGEAPERGGRGGRPGATSWGSARLSSGRPPRRSRAAPELSSIFCGGCVVS